MRDYRTLSIPLGRWGGVEVRLHALFVLFAVFTLFLAVSGIGDRSMVWLAWASLGVLFASVLFHEIGHWQAALRLGGDADRIVLAPLGGLAPVHVPFNVRSELLAHLAGPAVNAVVCLFCLPLVIAWGSISVVPQLLHPLQPTPIFQPIGTAPDPAWVTGVKLTFWINWLLFLVNLLPAFPFDGGRVLRAAIMVIRPGTDRRRSALRVAQVAKVLAIVVLVGAYFCRNVEAGILPAWFALVLLAILLFFSARQEEDRFDEEDDEQGVFGYDFSHGYTSLEQNADPRPPGPGPIARWMQKQRDAKVLHRAELEAEEERRLDEILQRLHSGGRDILSDEDQALLKRVSARFRSRMSD